MKRAKRNIDSATLESSRALWGFKLLDYSKTAIAKFLFAHVPGAQIARGAIFKSLKDVVAISAMPEKPSWATPRGSVAKSYN